MSPEVLLRLRRTWRGGPERRRAWPPWAGWAAGGALLAAVVVVGALQLRDVDAGALLDGVRWPWVGLAAVLAAASFLGAAWNLVGFAPVPVRLGPAVAAQVAGTAVKLVTPASVGTVALNARLVQQAGARLPAALLCVAAAQAVQLVLTAAAVVVAVALPGGGLPLGLPRPSARAVAVVVGLLGAVALLAAPLVRAHGARLHQEARRVWPPVRAVLADPRRCAAGLGGAALITASLVGCLWASVRATGGHLGLLDVLVVLLAGSVLGSVAPTPGGVGGVEVVMAASLVTAGVAPAVAAAAVLLYRVLTFWAPVPLGLLLLAELRRRRRL